MVTMTDHEDEELVFEDDAPVAPAPATRHAARWKMLIVDDESEVHSITRLVLSDFVFKGRQAQFLSAYSAAEAVEILERERDIAVILLDVVMETDDAGLKLVHHIREVMGNRHVRIILRTGQPGQAPERNVILEYDINDYKAKTQLTAQQLFTCTVAALRSYEDLITIEANRRGLEKIIEASSSLAKTRSMKLFAAGVLTQLSAIVGAGPDAILCVQRGDVRRRDRIGLYILAGSGRFEALINEPLTDRVDAAIEEAVRLCLTERRNVFQADQCAMYIRSLNDRENVVYLDSNRPLGALDQRLIELFCDKISVGFETIYLYEQLLKAQEATVATLAELAETAEIDIDSVFDEDSHRHQQLLRIATLSELITRRLHAERKFRDQIDEPFLEMIGLASMLHDVGNISVSDRILRKPGALDDEERRVVRQHTLRGSAILNRACRMVEGLTYLELGAEIARFHHENYDGSGYPEGLSGEAIPLAARIVAVADTYDALTSPRPYRPALDHGSAIEEVRRMSGRRFDPVVVEAFLKAIALNEAGD
jgi:response regulator RpfG family c-di-GMP phosphodiesterase